MHLKRIELTIILLCSISVMGIKAQDTIRIFLCNENIVEFKLFLLVENDTIKGHNIEFEYKGINYAYGYEFLIDNIETKTVKLVFQRGKYEYYRLLTSSNIREIVDCNKYIYQIRMCITEQQKSLKRYYKRRFVLISTCESISQLLEINKKKIK